MIRHIIFDIGNVLVSFQPVAYFQDHFQKDDVHALCDMIFQDPMWLRYDEGVVFADELRAYYLQRYPQRREEIVYILEHWMEMMQPLTDMIDTMARLKAAGYGIYILSNISADSAAYLKRTTSIFTYADGHVFSCDEKCLKPALALYEKLLSAYGLSACECVFLDDRLENTDTARRLGMQAVTVADSKQAIADLYALLEGAGRC